MRAGRAVLGAAGAVSLAHMLPSTLVLGQWSKARALPDGSCRWRGPDVAKVAITFDDGPAPGYTDRVLDQLDALNLRATFFCLGAKVRAHPDLAAEVVQRGHTVGTHGFQHDSHFARTPRWVGNDLRSALRAHTEAGLAAPRWFRPPYGHVTSATVWHARRAGLPIVLWSASGLEWSQPTADAVAEHVTRTMDRGAIVLLHDTDVSNPAGSTQRVLDALGTHRTTVARSRLRLGHARSVGRRNMTHSKTRNVLILSGRFGKGHDTVAEATAAALAPLDVQCQVLDSIALLGGRASGFSDRIFRILLSMTPVYDALHFSQLRTGSRLARFMDRAALRTMYPQFLEHTRTFPPDLIVSVFATGAAAAARYKSEHPDVVTAVFITDSYAHRLWVHDQTDIFLVTSSLAARSVQGLRPRARVEVVTGPTRPEFYTAPPQHVARASLGIPADVRCVLLMSGAWGIGPVAECARIGACRNLGVGGCRQQRVAQTRARSTRRERPPFGPVRIHRSGARADVGKRRGDHVIGRHVPRGPRDRSGTDPHRCCTGPRPREPDA